jgi:hypothetical protein
LVLVVDAQAVVGREVGKLDFLHLDRWRDGGDSYAQVFSLYNSFSEVSHYTQRGGSVWLRLFDLLTMTQLFTMFMMVACGHG